MWSIIFNRLNNEYTWSSIGEQGISLSTVDHIVGNKRVYDAVVETGVLHSHGENLSDHSPIYAKIRVGDLDISTETILTNKTPSWTKAGEKERIL